MPRQLTFAQAEYEVVKNRFGHRKVRYKGLKKNTAQATRAVRPGQPGDRQEGVARLR